MVWLVPGALIGLALIAAPLIIHLLTRQRAPRLAFPTVRFVRPSVAAAVRLRKPSDAGLLLVRVGVIGAVSLAAAQPLALTKWRLAAWNGRIARAIVVDTSESMRRVEAQGREPATLAADVALAESSSAVHSVRVETGNIADGLTRAARLLEVAPPARREIVVISDFQLGSLTESMLAAIPGDIGLRMIRVGQPAERRSASANSAAAWKGARWTATVQIDPRSTHTTWRRASATDDIGVTLVTSAGDERASAAALRAATSLGAFLQQDRPVRIVFPGASRAGTNVEPLRTPWMVNAVLALRRTDAGQHVTSTGEQRGVLVLETSVPAGSVAAARLIQVVLAARVEPVISQEAEVATLTDADLARWRREPARIGPNVWPRAERSDSRWLWSAALVLLAVEWWLRRNRVLAEKHVNATAA